MMAPRSAETCSKETVSRFVWFLVHETLVGLIEFDIKHGTYNIKIINNQSTWRYVPEGCNLHIHGIIADHQQCICSECYAVNV
jgi:hypothetical protein